MDNIYNWDMSWELIKPFILNFKSKNVSVIKYIPSKWKNKSQKNNL